MEHGYMVLTVASKKASDEIEFKLFTANTDAGAQRLKGKLRNFREREGCQLLVSTVQTARHQDKEQGG